MFAIIGSNCLKVLILFYFFGQMFLLLYALGFHACIFLPLGWLWLKTILSISDFLETFPCNSSLPDFRLKRAGQLNG